VKRIVIERYDATKHDTPHGEWPYSGLIEGETDDGQTWIMWIDRQGRPEVFWPQRDESGAVLGDGIPLTMGQFGSVFRNLGVEGDADCSCPDHENNGVISTWPIFDDGKRGIVFAVVPGEGTHREKLYRFLSELTEQFAPDVK
jgi:hypothetical protein